MPRKLVTPPERSVEEQVFEHAELLLAQALLDLRRLDTGRPSKRCPHRSEDFAEGYAQGTKEAARIILICIGKEAVGLDSSAADVGMLEELTGERL
jgi:hypothetical protein